MTTTTPGFLLMAIAIVQGLYIFTNQGKEIMHVSLIVTNRTADSTPLGKNQVRTSLRPNGKEIAADSVKTPSARPSHSAITEAAANITQARTHYYKEPIIPNAGPNDFQGVRARAFQPWSGEDIPCIEPEKTWKDYNSQLTPTTDGLIFIKTYKTGSSTASGINLRLARNAARRQHKAFEICKSRSDHIWAKSLVPNRDKSNSFLWTIIRDPTSRILSQLFHFHVSRKKNDPTDSSLIARIREKNSMTQEYYLEQLSTKGHSRGKGDPVQTVNAILEEYDFIAVTERMDESAVAMAMLTGVPLSDALYLKAKVHGGFDGGGGHHENGGKDACTYLTPAFLSKGMDEYFRSDEWQERVEWDHVFYQAANRSLDLTIEQLGREKFEENLTLYLQAKKRAQEVCLPKTTFPCSNEGQLNLETDCLWKDSACGSDCLDEVATEMNLDSSFGAGP